jgi:hypothetical protein
MKVWNMTEIDVEWIMIHVYLAVVVLVLVPLSAMAIFIFCAQAMMVLFPEWRVSQQVDLWLNADVYERIAARGDEGPWEKHLRIREERRVLAQHAMQQRGGDY